MDLEKAMLTRHVVRKYKNINIPEVLRQEVIYKLKRLCDKYGVAGSVKLGDEKYLQGIFSKIFSKNIKNIILLKGDDFLIGYIAAQMMLFLQSKGLNSWFVGESINHKVIDDDVRAMIVFGFGQNNGKAHRTKSVEQISDYDESLPEWYLEGIKATILAPTALNKQNFKILYNNGKPKLVIKYSEYSKLEAGIISFYFESISRKKIDYTIVS